MKRSRYVLVTLLFLLPGMALANFDRGERAAIETELAELAAEIAAAQADVDRYGDGVIGTLAAARVQTLALTAAIVQARLAADAGAIPTEIIVPAVVPDPELAAEIETEMEAQKALIAEAEADVLRTGGLVQAVAISRVQAERLTLARLRGALMQARYGATLPIEIGETLPRDAVISEDLPAEERGLVANADPAQPDWADAAHPEIDYTAPIFAQLHEEGFEISGWWGIQETHAAVDDSPAVFAIQVQNMADNGRVVMTAPSLQLGCQEGTPSFIYDTDDYLLTDFRSNSIRVTYRIDDAPAREDSWSELTNNEGAGVFGARGVGMLRDLYNADKAFFRIIERDGEHHDASFDLAGISAAIDAAATACAVSMLDLDRDDYRAIQEMLNAGGYDAGTPDGIWGSGSGAALRAYQEANGIEPTGVPDRETLLKMGLTF